MRLSLAAKVMGKSRAYAYRKLRQYAVFSEGPNPRLEVDSARVFKLIANERLGELPILPEARTIIEKLESIDAGQEKLYEVIGAMRTALIKVAGRQGVAV